MAKATLLIADDERLILATLGMGLRDAGYEVIEASSGEEAIELCEQHQPDLAILDINMPPGMSGIAAAREIRDRTAVPVMFLSAYDDDKHVQQAVAEGALGYLVKPVDVTKIAPSIEAARVQSRELMKLRNNEINLGLALQSGRERSVAIGMIMERYKLTEHQAFESLRSLARRQRRKIDDVVQEVIEDAGIIRDMAENRGND
jgi:AmiR/NasT family two-component response regulator